MQRILYGIALVSLEACGSGHSATGPSRAQLTVVSGDSQTGTFGAALGSPIVLHLAPGTAVSWQATIGPGTISAPAMSDSDGQIRGVWTLGNTFFSQSVVVSAGSQSVTLHA